MKSTLFRLLRSTAGIEGDETPSIEPIAPGELERRVEQRFDLPTMTAICVGKRPQSENEKEKKKMPRVSRTERSASVDVSEAHSHEGFKTRPYVLDEEEGDSMGVSLGVNPTEVLDMAPILPVTSKKGLAPQFNLDGVNKFSPVPTEKERLDSQDM